MTLAARNCTYLTDGIYQVCGRPGVADWFLKNNITGKRLIATLCLRHDAKAERAPDRALYERREIKLGKKSVAAA